MWNQKDFDFTQTQDLACAFVEHVSFAAGELRRLLSTDPSDGACTGVYRIRNRHQGRLACAADIYVLEGNGTLNSFPFSPHHYFHVPAGSSIDLVPGARRTTAYIGFFAEPTFETGIFDEEAEINHADVEAMPWRKAEWADDDDLDPGVAVKWLRRDQTSEMFLTAMQPGWRSEPEEAHAEIYEESFRLAGDLLQGARGVMHAGAYSYRSPDIWHAPLYTRNGTMSVIRSGAPITTVFRDPDPGRRWFELVDAAYGSIPSPAV